MKKALSAILLMMMIASFPTLAYISSPTMVSRSTSSLEVEDEDKDEDEDRKVDQLKGVKDACRADIVAATTKADKEAARKACIAAIKAKQSEIKESKETKKEDKKENNQKKVDAELKALKDKCRADVAAAAEVDKPTVKATCEAAIKAKKESIKTEKKEAKEIKKEIKKTVKEAKKETKKAVKDSRKKVRNELKSMKIQCNTDVAAAAEADKAAVKKACVATIKTKRTELRTNIKEIKATEYAAVKAKVDAYIATLSEEEKVKYIKNFNRRYEKLIEKAEENGQDAIVVNLEATKEAIEQE